MRWQWCTQVWGTRIRRWRGWREATPLGTSQWPGSRSTRSSTCFAPILVFRISSGASACRNNRYAPSGWRAAGSEKILPQQGTAPYLVGRTSCPVEMTENFEEHLKTSLSHAYNIEGELGGGGMS